MFNSQLSIENKAVVVTAQLCLVKTSACPVLWNKIKEGWRIVGSGCTLTQSTIFTKAVFNPFVSTVVQCRVDVLIPPSLCRA